MTLPGCSIIIIDLFSLYPGLHMCKQGLPVNTGSLAACCWSRVWAAVGTVASRVTAGCWDCVILWWFVWCIDRINVNKDFLIIIWLGTFRFINVCIREIPCFKWNYNVNLDVVHESGTKTQICYFPCNSSKTFMFSICTFQQKMSDQFFSFYAHILGHISSILVIKQVLDNIF